MGNRTQQARVMLLDHLPKDIRSCPGDGRHRPRKAPAARSRVPIASKHVAEMPRISVISFLRRWAVVFSQSRAKSSQRRRDLQASHAYVGKTLPVIAKKLLPTFAGTKSQKFLAFQLRALKQLAREIELLAPSVDDGGRRPDNCEYPWEDGQGALHVPAEYDFPSMKLLATPVGRLLPRLLNRAID